jgi:hypothetical protein
LEWNAAPASSPELVEIKFRWKFKRNGFSIELASEQNGNVCNNNFCLPLNRKLWKKNSLERSAGTDGENLYNLEMGEWVDVGWES